ncbi:MAG: AAA family ATPase, partial [Candidatus Eremiobacteraeota bacterium]|nr:AAA family ATPase [Candidatus Eremiobacteraeota bacterium]
MISLPVTCPVFIGRRAELDVLAGARRGLAQSRGSFVLIGGEAGVGKSRLTAHFLQRSGDRRARNVATAECRQDVVEPLRPIRTILEAFLSAGEPLELPSTARRALARIGRGPADAGYESAGGPLDRADFYAGLVALFVALAAKRATILIIEDIHWADSSTLDFLTYLAPSVAGTRLLVIATHRSEELEGNRQLLRARTRIEREATVRHLTLEPFEGGELSDLIVSALDGRATIDDASFQSIVTRSEGNAFFAEELLKDALTSRRRYDGRLPISIRGTIAARLENFDRFERRVLSYAAVLGLRFDPALLAAILAQDIEDVLPVLAHAR